LSYLLYHTDAFILGGTPFGEGSKLLTLLTREFGLIVASVSSVRAERSKLRYGLQDFSYSKITLVRGKEFWRITSVTDTESLFEVFRHSPEKIQLFARVFSLLRRLLAGEEKHEELFSAVTETFAFLRTNGPPTVSIGEVEVVLVLRLLHLLGYLAPQKEFSVFLSDPLHWGSELFPHAAKLRALAVSRINHSLRASQL